MEFVFEVLVQFVVEVIFDAIIGPLFRGSRSRPMSAARQRLVVQGVVAVVAGGLGYGWGRHVAHIGQTTTPRSIWVSLVVAVAAVAVAISRRTDERSPNLLQPMRWPASRLLGLAAANLVAAIGIWIGFKSGGSAPLR